MVYENNRPHMGYGETCQVLDDAYLTGFRLIMVYENNRPHMGFG